MRSPAVLGPRNYVAGGRPPATDLGDEVPVRITVYVLPGQLERLRAIVQMRQREGRRCDVSRLIREAIESIFPSEPVK